MLQLMPAVLRRPIAVCALLMLLIPRTARAQAAGSAEPAQAQTPPAQEQPAPISRSVRNSHIIPLVDIVLFDFLVNRAGSRFVDHSAYDVGPTSIRRNLHSGWVLDNDPFSTNQFMHPYQGAMYHGFARSAGLSYLESLGDTFAGSVMWEIAGETTLPSKNDQIATGIGGTFLGEPLFRMGNLILEKSDRLPRFWRELSAAVISPATGFNRLVYGDRFKTVLPTRSPSFFTRAQFGVMGTASVRKSFTESLTRNEAVADFSIDYGLPGNPKYDYRRPFDYFNFQFTASSANRFENIFSRGLLVGQSYGAGAASYRGVWGLYGTYDYVAPQLFRVSSTALALGTTLQRPMWGTSAIQSTLLSGVGYGAAGTINGSGTRDFHYGLTPQVLVANRVILSDWAAFELTLRDYYVSSVASTEHRGSEKIARADALLTFRFHTHQAMSARYIWSRRSASYPDLGDVVQSRGSFGLFYTYVSRGSRLGAVDW
jgi:predicted transcriptional regulator